MSATEAERFSDLPIQIPLSMLRRWLRDLSILYLCLPVPFFLLGWLHPLAAWTGTLLFLVGVFGFVRHRAQHMDGSDACYVSLPKLCLGVLLVSVPVAICGAGGFGPQTWDWVKHNAILRDLITQPWPVIYATQRDTVALVYYIAYYLPAAFIGKLAGWAAANIALFIFTWLGTVLVLTWLVVFARGSVLLATAVFVFFSGMDLVGAMIINPVSVWPTFVDAYHLEWWAKYWQNSSNLSLLFFVPQQALGAWLVTALLADGIVHDQDHLPVALLLAIAALWSPFVAIGLVPFACMYFARTGVKSGLYDQWSLANLAGIALALVFVLYYASRYAAYRLPDVYVLPSVDPLPGSFDLIFKLVPAGEFAWRYAVFVFCEFLLLALVLFMALRDPTTRRERRLIYVATGTLLLLPLFYNGIYNDLVMRTSIPALFVLQIGVVSLLKRPLPKFWLFAVATVLVAGAVYSVNLLRLQSLGVYQRAAIVRIPEPEHVSTLLHIERPPQLRLAFARQYLGSSNTLFFRWLAPELQPHPVPVPKHWQDLR